MSTRCNTVVANMPAQQAAAICPRCAHRPALLGRTTDSCCFVCNGVLLPGSQGSAAGLLCGVHAPSPYGPTVCVVCDATFTRIPGQQLPVARVCRQCCLGAGARMCCKMVAPAAAPRPSCSSGWCSCGGSGCGLGAAGGSGGGDADGPAQEGRDGKDGKSDTGGDEGKSNGQGSAAGGKCEETRDGPEGGDAPLSHARLACTAIRKSDWPRLMLLLGEEPGLGGQYPGRDLAERDLNTIVGDQALRRRLVALSAAGRDSTPLHMACTEIQRKGGPADAIIALMVSGCPGASCVANMSGNTALHSAAANTETSLATIEVLLADALSAQGNRASAFASRIEMLVSMGFPANRVEKALIMCNTMNTPIVLEWLIAHSGDADIDEAAVHSAADTIETAVHPMTALRGPISVNGATPLHHAIAPSSTASPEIIAALFAAFPGAVRVVCEQISSTGALQGTPFEHVSRVYNSSRGGAPMSHARGAAYHAVFRSMWRQLAPTQCPSSVSSSSGHASWGGKEGEDGDTQEDEGEDLRTLRLALKVRWE